VAKIKAKNNETPANLGFALAVPLEEALRICGSGGFFQAVRTVLGHG